MAINIAGSTGQGLLDTTLAHEFNHAAQASDDWWESALFFEMTSTFVEALTYPQQDDYFFTLNDFQRRPEWSIFYVDNYATWHMYGAAMYLHFLSERYYPNDPMFIARMWRGTRSAPTGNRPDYIDAIRAALLADRGVALDETVIEFMQWRWFVAQFDDGLHFSQGANWPAPVSFLDIDPSTLPAAVDLGAMMFGGNYVRLVNDTASPLSINIELSENDADVDWHLSTVEGVEIVSMMTIPPQSTSVLVAIAMPVNEVYSNALTFVSHTASLSMELL